MPNQRQAWYVAAAMAIVLGILFGTTLSSFGVFTLPLVDAFAATNEQVANMSSFFMLSMTLAMPLSGWLLDRVGPRLVMVSGVGVGMSTYVPATAVVLRWVTLPQQGLAVGLMLAGGSMGAIIFPPLLTSVIEQYHWHGAMQLISALMLLLVVPILLCFARLPASQQTQELARLLPGLEGASLRTALRARGYWLWVGMQILLTFSVLGVFINLVPYLIRSGYTPVQAAGIFSATSVCALLGHFMFGFINTRWDARLILMLTTGAGIIGILALLSMFEGWLGYAALGIFVLAWGGTFNLVNQFSPMLMARMVGARHFGLLLGLGSLIAGLGSAFSPTLTGYLLDLSQSYVLVLLLCIVCMLLALPLISLLPGREISSEGNQFDHSAVRQEVCRD